MLYDLARGGAAPEFGAGCKGCLVNTENGLPVYLQPDHRDGYHFRDKRTWESLLNDLDKRYNKDVTDLNVGDKLRIFLQPNHANLKSLFIDFRQPVAGFKFKLVSANGTDYAGTTKKADYSKCSGIESVEAVEGEIDTANVEAYTQFTTLVADGYNPKVEAIDLEILALPKDIAALQSAEMLFARRFEVEGYMMPSVY